MNVFIRPGLQLLQTLEQQEPSAEDLDALADEITQRRLTSRSRSYMAELITDEEIGVDCYSALQDERVTCADRASVYVTAPHLFTGRRPYCSAHEHLIHSEWMVGI